MKKMGRVIMYVVFVGVAAFVTSCGTLGGGSTTAENQLSQSDRQALMAAYNAQAQALATDKDDDHVAEFLSQNTDSGAVGWARVKRVAQDPETGAVLFNSDGSPIVEELEAIGKSNSHRELSPHTKEVIFKLAGFAVDPQTKQLTRHGLEGVYAHAWGDGMGTTLNTDFAKVWAGKSVEEKRAGADAVAASLRERKGMVVEAITATGEIITGTLKEVYRATPIGAASTLVDVLVETEDDGAKRGQVVKQLPDPETVKFDTGSETE